MFLFLNVYQVEIINDLPEDKTITVYRCGPLVDLCRGPHIPNTSFVKAFACLKVMFKPHLRCTVGEKFTYFLKNTYICIHEDYSGHDYTTC